MKYKLGSLTVNNWNDWDRVPRDPATIGGFILGAFGSSGAALAAVGVFGTTVGAIVGYLAISTVTSWALSALAPKPDFSSFGSQGTLVNARDAVASADFVYGEVRKGGVVTFYESTGTKNKFLHQVIAIAAHEVEELGDIYLNDEIVTLNESGFVTSSDWVRAARFSGADLAEMVIEGSVVDGDKKSAIRIHKYLGDQITADSDLVSETSVDSSFVGYGIAYLYVRYEYDQDVFANGLPLVTVMVKGKKVYDPRTTSTAYSNNAALCMRDFLTSEYGLNDSAIDDVSFSAAANECDENVALDAGGTEKRYTTNGIVKASTPLKTVLGNMSTACAGTLFWGSGYWKLKVGAYSSPVKTLTLDDLRGPINLQTRISMRDNFNTIRGTFNDAEQDYITADYPELTSPTFKTEDYGEEVALDLPLPFTTSAASAQRIAKLTLFRGREQMTLSADFGLEAFSIEVGDTIAFDNPRYGFDEKEFEVTGWSFAANQQAGDLRVTLTLRETSEAAFDWDAEESAIISNNTNLLKYNEAPSVSIAPSFVSQVYSESPTSKVVVLIDSTRSSEVDYVEVQAKFTGSDTAIRRELIPQALLYAGVNISPQKELFKDNLLGDIDQNGVVGAADALEYLEYLRSTQTDQAIIDYIEGTFHPTMIQNPEKYIAYLDNFVPPDVDFVELGSGDLGRFEYLNASEGKYDIRARAVNAFGFRGDWEYHTGFSASTVRVSPPDVDGFSYDLSGSDVQLSWSASDAQDLSYYVIRHTPETSGAEWGDSTVAVRKVARPATNVSLPARSGTYLIKAFTKSNLQSSGAAQVTIASDQIAPFATTLTATEDPTFAGSDSGTTTVGSNLEISSVSFPDSSGTYTFANTIDAGSGDKRVFARVDATVARRNLSSNLFDDLSGGLDSLPGLWDDLNGSTSFGDTNVEFFIRVSPDGGSYGDWQKFRSGYFYGRYFQFKVTLRTETANVTPSISALSAIVEHN